MSDFLEDQSSDKNTHTSSSAPKDVQSPLLLTEMGVPEDMFAPAKISKHSNHGVVAGLLVVGAVGVIFAMRQFGLGPAVSLAEMSIDYEPAPVSVGAAPGKVLSDLDRSRRAIQVPAELITQDPFELDNAQTTVEQPTVDPDLARRAEEESLRLAREQRKKELDDALAKLKLQSVMGGSKPIARIDNQVCKMGMMVGEFFMISRIEGRKVTLTADGYTFVLSMEKND